MDDESGREDDFERQEEPWRWTWKTTVMRSGMPILLCGILTFFVPRFIPLYDALNTPLPTATRLLIMFSLFLRGYAFLMPVFVAVAVAMDHGGYVLCRGYFGYAAGNLWRGFIVACYLASLGFCTIALSMPLQGKEWYH